MKILLAVALCVLSVSASSMSASGRSALRAASMQGLTVTSQPATVIENKTAVVTGNAPGCGLDITVTFNGTTIPHTVTCVNGKFSIKAKAPSRQDNQPNTLIMVISHGTLSTTVVIPVAAL